MSTLSASRSDNKRRRGAHNAPIDSGPRQRLGARVPDGGAWAAAVAPQAALKKKVVLRKVVGPAAPADRWGDVQVTLVVRVTTTTTGVKKKVTRRITDLSATAPDHTNRSVFINEQAIPLLRSEALQAQSAKIDLVSGATDTSYAFGESLQAALAKARSLR